MHFQKVGFYPMQLPVVSPLTWVIFDIFLLVGIFYAFAIVGPAIGYLAGGAFLNLYVDFDSVNTNRYVWFS